MSVKLSPPSLQIPTEFAVDKEKAGFFSGLINTIYQLWYAVYGIRSNAKITTTDATITGIVRIEVPTNKTVMIQACVVARRTGGVSGAVGDSAFYVLTGCYKNIAGTLTGVGSPNIIGGEDQIAWDTTFSSTGEFAVVTVQGAAGNNITWEGTFYTYTVGA